MQLANSQTLIDTLFGDPEIQKAQEIETVIADSMNLEKQEGEDDLDFQIRQQKAVREGTAKLDPNVAVQANQQIAQLQVEREERDRLLADRADEKEITRRETKKYEHENTHVVLATDANGNTQIVSSGKFDETGKEFELRMDEAKELSSADPNNTYEVVPLSVLLDGSAKTKNGDFALPAGDQRRFFESIQALNGVSIGIADMSKSLQDNMFALTFGSEAEATAGSAASRAAAELTGYYSGRTDKAGRAIDAKTIEGWEKQDAGLIEARFGSNKWTKRADKAVISGTIRAQVKELAYKLAKTLDPSGRLSDQDVDMAIEMIVGSGDPKELEKLLRRRLEKTHAQMDTQIHAAKRGHVFGQYGQREAAKVDALMQQAFGELTALATQIQEWKEAGGQDVGPGEGLSPADRSELDNVYTK
jgi:hypothetical protein